MALHLSTLNTVQGTNVSFINNSAQEVGGAILTVPDLMHSYTLQRSLAIDTNFN